ncbi:hypothetical protein [Candidatus Chlorohelix sp.]|uniref:hypothetical protein n=1 Tax=Candidatus Chlorohelix sp. TaxID=3139201 RepID=UPI0030355C19
MSSKASAETTPFVRNWITSGVGKGWSIAFWFAIPVLLRLVFMPVSHYWDTQIWYSFFADIKFDHSPYDTLQTLSYETRSERIYPYYEYFAYPPGILYLYYPVGKFYALLDPNLNYVLGRGFIPLISQIPWFFYFIFKIPVMLADVGIMALLWKMGGKAVAQRYAYSPYVIMVMIWMFDPIMVFFMLLGVYTLERKNYDLSAISFALGTVIKFVPVFILPAILLYLLRKNITFISLLRYIAVFGITTGVLIFPYLRGTLFTLEFHGGRIGSGLSWQSIFNLVLAWAPQSMSISYATALSASIGSLFLLIGMLVVYAYTYRMNLTLNSTIVVTLLGYLAFTKIVNEVYALAVIPFILLELKTHTSAKKERFYKLFWSIPLGWAIINVPAYLGFAWISATFDAFNYPSLVGLSDLSDQKSPMLIYFVVGSFYTLLCLFGIPLFSIKETKN